MKLYKIKSNLVDFNNDTLESSIDFKHEDENIFFGLQSSVYETLKESYNDKYEYILPEITVDKNLFSDDKNGNLDLQTNLKVHNYDTNRLTSFINDFNWNSKEIFSDLGIKNQLLANVKNINYESKNVDPYKNDFTSELFGAIGLMTELNLEKDLGLYKHFLTPKIFLRYSPGSMRQEDAGSSA